MSSKTDNLHVAIIMDGNGRWATRRGLPRSTGHESGAKAVRRIVEAAARYEIDTLTLYTFSSDNWGRPEAEVERLMKLFRRKLASEAERCVRNGVRLNVIGRRDRIHPDLVATIEEVERATEHCTQLNLRLAVDYSARDAITRAARSLTRDLPVSVAAFSELINRVTHSAHRVADVDLLIRTGGERRLSDFLLWECAYAELVFSDRLWPDFQEQDLGDALVEFRNRERRFGRLLYSAP